MVLVTPFAVALHTYRPAYDSCTGEDSVSVLEEVLPEVVRDPSIPAEGVIHVTLVGGPGVDEAVQFKT